ncbi:MAG: peptidylprolyl isomerase [Pseudomonadota bacterium]
MASAADEEGKTVLRVLLTDPLTLFFAAGALIFGLFSVLERRADNPVVLDSDVRRALVGNFEGITGQKASAGQIALLERDYIIDEILFREALERGIHLTDSQTKKQLIDTMRRLIAGPMPSPSEADLVNYYGENIEDYRGEPTLNFAQVFFEEMPEDPEAVRAALAERKGVAGDEYWMGDEFRSYSEGMVRSIFGMRFLETALVLPIGQWSGPIETERGVHFVLMDAPNEPELIPFAEVRDQVEQDFWMDAAQEKLDATVETMKDRYEVIIDVAPQP